MKTYRYFIYISLCIIFCFSCSIFAEEQTAQIASSDISTQEPKEIATFESVNKWKATLFLQPIIQKLAKRADGTEVEQAHTLCYVGISFSDLNEIYPVWQCVFANIPGLGNLLPDKFVFGPAEDNKLCLAFRYHIPTASICFFVLDPNNKINLYKKIDEAFEDKNSPNARLESQDPNNVIPISEILKQDKDGTVILGIQGINSVYYYENSAIFNLSDLINYPDRNINYILHYSIVDEKPAYSIYKLTDFE